MGTLAAISFTTPAMLAGTTAAALPILAHLLNRRTRRRIVFPTVRLLQQSRASQSRLFRLRRWLLLALRCLAILCIVLAFSRPVWMDRDVPAPARGKGAAVVLVLDRSASTAQQADGVSLVNSMQALAGRTLSALSSGADVVNLVYASGQPRAAFPQLTYNLSAVREELQHLAATSERANFPEAIALAGRLLASHQGQRRLVILSDMQRTNWAEVRLKGKVGELIPEGTQITVLPAEAGEPANTSLSEPRCLPVQPIVNQEAQLLVHAVNYAAEARTVGVGVTVNGRPAGSLSVLLKPWETQEIAFQVKLNRPGQHQIVFSTPADALAVDNHAYLVVTAVRRVPVVVIGDDDPNQPGTSTYFLVRALAPRGDMGDELEVRHFSGSGVSYGGIADAESVFVGFVGALGADALKALHTYANQGGGVVVFCGDGPVAANLLAFNALARHGELLPWLPGPQRDLSRDGGFLRISEGAWGTPLLGDFDEKSQYALGQVPFGKVWSAGPLRPGATKLLTFNDGTPALSASHVGAGKLLVANFSPALGCSDLGKYGSFVALMHGLVHYLRPSQDWRGAAVVGEPFSYTASVPTDAGGGSRSGQLKSLGPDGGPCPAEVTGEGAQLLVHLPRPTLPGFYKVLRDDEPLAAAAVNVDPREGDLRRLSRDDLAKRLRDEQVGLEIRSPHQEGPILSIRGRELWSWFLAGAMVAAGLELMLLSIWKR